MNTRETKLAAVVKALINLKLAEKELENALNQLNKEDAIWFDNEQDYVDNKRFLEDLR